MGIMTGLLGHNPLNIRAPCSSAEAHEMGFYVILFILNQILLMFFFWVSYKQQADVIKMALCRTCVNLLL